MSAIKKHRTTQKNGPVRRHRDVEELDYIVRIADLETKNE
jgi:hypothetical protein